MIVQIRIAFGNSVCEISNEQCYEERGIAVMLGKALSVASLYSDDDLLCDPFLICLLTILLGREEIYACELEECDDKQIIDFCDNLHENISKIMKTVESYRKQIKSI